MDVPITAPSFLDVERRLEDERAKSSSYSKWVKTGVVLGGIVLGGFLVKKYVINRQTSSASSSSSTSSSPDNSTTRSVTSSMFPPHPSQTTTHHSGQQSNSDIHQRSHYPSHHPVCGAHSGINQDRWLESGTWLNSANGQYYLIQRPYGALEVWRGQSPDDPNRSLRWSNGIHFKEVTQAFTVVTREGQLLTYAGDPINKGSLLWTSSPIVNPEYNALLRQYPNYITRLQLTDEGQAILGLSYYSSPIQHQQQPPVLVMINQQQQPMAIVWRSFSAIDRIPSGTIMNVGDWFQSADGLNFIVQTTEGNLEIWRGNNPLVPEYSKRLIWSSESVESKIRQDHQEDINPSMIKTEFDNGLLSQFIYYPTTSLSGNEEGVLKEKVTIKDLAAFPGNLTKPYYLVLTNTGRLVVESANRDQPPYELILGSFAQDRDVKDRDVKGLQQQPVPLSIPSSPQPSSTMMIPRQVPLTIPQSTPSVIPVPVTTTGSRGPPLTVLGSTKPQPQMQVLNDTPSQQPQTQTQQRIIRSPADLFI